MTESETDHQGGIEETYQAILVQIYEIVCNVQHEAMGITAKIDGWRNHDAVMTPRLIDIELNVRQTSFAIEHLRRVLRDFIAGAASLKEKQHHDSTAANGRSGRNGRHACGGWDGPRGPG